MNAILKNSRGISAAILVLMALTVGSFAFLASPVHAVGPLCAVPSADYPTIQSAVDDATCTTVTVAAGTYAEHVVVNRSVVLNGANADVAATSTRAAESIVDGTDTGTPFSVTANGVTINGFTVENGSNGSLDAGIWSQSGTTNSSVINNLITHNAFGVWAQCGGTCLIQGNLFDGNNETGTGAGSASVSADHTTGLTINDNEFKNDTAGNPILLQATGAGAHTDITVSNNSFHDNAFSDIYAIGLTGGSIHDNIITPAADATGISFSGADTNVSVSKNVITGGSHGIRIEDAGYGLGGTSGLTITRNDVSSDSTYGVGNESGYTGNVNASCNWWGAANGPGPVGPGSGSPVTTGVTFSSWLASSDLNGSCANTAPVISNVSASSTATSTATVRWNTDAAATGQVFYGTTTSYGSTSLVNAVASTTHSFGLTALTEGTVYHYMVQSTNGGGTATSSDQVFTTSSTGSSTPLAVTGVAMTKPSGTADNTYENGWKYVFNITIPSNEANVAMKFSDWLSGSNTLPVANNMRISSAQADNGNATITLIAADTYTTPDLHLTGDLDPATPGIQAQILVEVRIPSGTSNGSYTTSYGLRSE